MLWDSETQGLCTSTDQLITKIVVYAAHLSFVKFKHFPFHSQLTELFLDVYISFFNLLFILRIGANTLTSASICNVHRVQEMEAHNVAL